MLPNLTQQQMLFQVLQLQQLQQLQVMQAAATKEQQQQPTDLLALYQTWLLSTNMQQLNPFLNFPQQSHSMPTTPITTTPSPMFFQQFPPKAVMTPPPSVSPLNDNKRKAMTINDLVESIPLLKRPCTAGLNAAPATPLTFTPVATAASAATCSSSPLITASNCLPTSPTANVSDNNSDTAAPASIKSRSESSSVSDIEPDEFIDVVGDAVPKTKAQRKAHIEFYRKMKLLRNREKELLCNLCNESVKNVEATVRAHVTSHADASMLICKLCCFSSGDLHQMFEHMGSQHPSNRTCYEDRRNMTQLSELLTTCFPRGGVKQRTGFLDSVQKVIDVAKKRDEPCVSCFVCNKDVQVTKEAITKHMNLHHVYRCKKCKSIFQDEEEMHAHCQKSHQIEAPKAGSDFHVSASGEATTLSFKKCFQKYLTES